MSYVFSYLMFKILQLFMHLLYTILGYDISHNYLIQSLFHAHCLGLT